VLNPEGDLLVVERSLSQVTLLFDGNADGTSGPNERVVLATAAGLNHGIAVGGGFLYASSATTVFRWPYEGGRVPLGTPQTVVTRLPSGGHSTRTLRLDDQGNLYVSIGSGGNVDGNSERARILRFTQAQLTVGATFQQGMLFADGLRNEVGLAIDSTGRLWGVENGVDNLARDDLGGDIHTDNPGEELNLFAEPGRFYGYPYCWSEYVLPTGVGLGPKTQWVHPDFMADGIHGDAWCRDGSRVVPPVALLPAHTAPLDIVFYTGRSFPADTVGDALVSLHGSWNRQPPIGYKVVRIPFGPDGMPSGEPESLLESASSGNPTQAWPHRPVGLAVGLRGEVFVTSDTSGVVIAIGNSGASRTP
jgi:glucose/arabinose dehydrogenase